MGSIILTISGFFLIFSLIGGVVNNIRGVRAESVSVFDSHLQLSANIFFPHKLNGSLGLKQEDYSSASFLIADEETGRFLESKNVQELRSIASITKLMSVLVWFDIDGDINKIVEFKSEDYREGGVAYFIAGEEVLAKDLLYTGIVASSNSAIAALVRSTGLTKEEFVGRMNKKARELGMDKTIFVEVTGLDSRNISTVRELYILAREAFKNNIIADASTRVAFSFDILNKVVTRNVKNTNWLLGAGNGDYNILGGKTGYIEESGYNLIVKAHSKNKNADIFVIVLGAKDLESRFSEVSSLIEWTYDNYIWKI